MREQTPFSLLEHAPGWGAWDEGTGLAGDLQAAGESCVLSEDRREMRCGDCRAREQRITPASPQRLVSVPAELVAPGRPAQRLDEQALRAYQQLYQAARAAGISDPHLKLYSGYRTYDQQKRIWRGKLMEVLRETSRHCTGLDCVEPVIDRTSDALRSLAVPHPRDAWLNRFREELRRAGYTIPCDVARAVSTARVSVATPGNSPHETGRALDLFVGHSPHVSGPGAPVRRVPENVNWQRRQASYQWLVCNAERFGFHPYNVEPWHWEYNPGSIEEGGERRTSVSHSPQAPASPSPGGSSGSPSVRPSGGSVDGACPPSSGHAQRLVARGAYSQARVFGRRRLRSTGELTNRIHAAMDIGGPRGAEVYAVLPGRVIFSGRKRGYGNLIVILHERPPQTRLGGSGAVTTAYAHLNERGVQQEDCVTGGQVIGRMGNTTTDDHGNSGGVPAGMGVHLHFSVQLAHGDPARPRRRFSDGAQIESRRISDLPPAQIGQRFSSSYEEDWTRQIKPDDWLRELGVNIVGEAWTPPARASSPRRTATARAQEFSEWSPIIQAELESFLDRFARIPVRVGSASVMVCPPYYINSERTAASRRCVQRARQHRQSAPAEDRAIFDDRSFAAARVGKGTIEQYASILQRAVAGSRVQAAGGRTSPNATELRAWLVRYGLGIDCSGFVTQALNAAMRRVFGRNPNESERLEGTPASALRGGAPNFATITRPDQLRPGDTMHKEGHIRVITKVEITGEGHVKFMTAESSSSGNGPTPNVWRYRNRENLTGLQKERSRNWNGTEWRDYNEGANTFGRYQPLARFVEANSPARAAQAHGLDAFYEEGSAKQRAAAIVA